MSISASTYFRTLSAVAVDLLLWFAIVALSVAAEAFVVVVLLHMPVSKLLHGGEPTVWIAQFLQPLIPFHS